MAFFFVHTFAFGCPQLFFFFFFFVCPVGKCFFFFFLPFCYSFPLIETYIMTDYIEERQMELEALESIYPDEYEAIGENEFRISIYPDEEDEEVWCGVSLHVTYTPNYPDELPEFDIEVIDGSLSDSLKNKMMDDLRTAGEESLGMAMIFTMASLLKEQLNEMVSNAQRIREEAEEERQRKLEEVEMAKFNGTKVTIERFLAWKKGFDKELEALEDQAKLARAKELKNKLTGRQLFEQDKTLASSDAKYMDEGDVSVDATQFEKVTTVVDEDDDKDAVWKRFGNEEE
ncbi:ubiquitin-conjugating enzyme/RWD-like protein [Halteromyces radiatus]|uniref:ubiquitin-conjugating enzyme/RWD-like protein n=1 Tax=Halteromyces radiatus TaxID=101107 RepID=UPI00221ECD24|nr:ubiquitin-conjugating enzyme/RWD-like protein [Halteromyces radiatus]KAI8093402.1 ubiquitin-conjugating enzyme/RWD-like protein [Halteromyces radiatus]